MNENVRTDIPKQGAQQDGRQTAPATATGRVFLSGVMVLTFSTVLVKILGVFYKIPMLRFLGTEGMGYFNAAYEWYALLCVISTAGLPVASSMLIARARTAGDAAAIRRVERLSLRVFLLLGFVGALALFFGAGDIARGIGSPDTVYALRAVAPTLFFSCMSGAYRGYFQGFQDMMPTALSQLIEALGKLGFGLGLGIYAWKRGMNAPMIAAWAMLGLTIGVGLSVLYLIVRRMTFKVRAADGSLLTEAIDKPHGNGEFDRPMRELMRIAVPITLSSAVLCVTKIVDMAMILRRLQDIGYDTAAANAVYGSYTTMAVPIFNLVPALLGSVALALIPTLTAQVRAGDREGQRETARSAVRITVLLAMPATVAVAFYSRAILQLLFRGEAAIGDTAPLLSLLALSILFSGLITTTNAILQAYGWVKVPVVSMLAGSAVKMISAYLLIGNPAVNIYGAPVSTLLCNVLVVGINLFLIARRAAILESPVCFLRPMLLSCAAVGIPGVLYVFLSNAGYPPVGLFLAAIPLTVILFAVFCFRWNLIGEREIGMLPGRSGERVLRVYRKIRGI